MIRKLIRYGALASLIGVGACENSLVVDNPNQGDTKKVLATPADAEALIGQYYKRWYTGVYGSLESFEGRGNIWAMMSFSSLANNCQNTSYPFTSAGVVNTPGNSCSPETYRLYLVEGEVNRVASSFLGQLDGVGVPKALDLGTPARNLRARSFAEFLRGLSLGYIALMYDSAAVISATTGSDDAGTLVGYVEVMDSAYAALGRAEIAANNPLATSIDGSGFPVATTWIPSPTVYSAPLFVQLIRSYRARFRANVARTPAERAAANWPLIIADAAAGITVNENIVTGTATGGVATHAYRSQYNTFSTWHQMPPFVIGMGDTSGTYATWNALPVGDRGAGNNAFFMATPDLRFPQGTTRTAQAADFPISSCEVTAAPCKRYFFNRAAGNDQFGGVGWGWSNYDFGRFRSWFSKGDGGTGRVGKTPIFMVAELDMLRAEGQYRAGAFAAAGALINKTRTAGMVAGVATGGGLPAITVFDATTPVPGSVAGCVPKVPVGPSFTSVACGNLWEAMKWEKRIETGYVAYLSWYLDARGWGDLAEGSPLFLPVPYQDWQARGKPANLLYGTGQGVGSAPNSTAVKGTYGW